MNAADNNENKMDTTAVPEIISVLVPTRQRPANMKRLWESLVSLAKEKQHLEIVFVCDNDDALSLHQYEEMVEEQRKSNGSGQIRVIVQPRNTNLSQLWNDAKKIATGDIFFHCGDDIIMRTQDWDSLVRNAFNKYPDHIAFVHGRDGVWEDKDHYTIGEIVTPGVFGTHGFLHRKWVETTGYFCPPYFQSDYNDAWFNEVADQLNRHVYLPELFTEHMHYCVGKSEKDQNTIERLERHNIQNPAQLYASKSKERLADVAKLRSVIEFFASSASISSVEQQPTVSSTMTTCTSESKNVGFIGCGKLGLPVCVAMGFRGYNVLAYDVNPKMKEGANAHDFLIPEEQGYEQQTASELTKQYPPKFANTIKEVVKHANLIFVAVQTPHQAQFEGTQRLTEERADFEYQYVKEALSALNQEIEKVQQHKVVVLISTVLPGTTGREFQPIFATNPYFHFAYNPYFIAMGTVIRDFLQPEFILLGVDSNDSFGADTAEQFYLAVLGKPKVYRTTIESAELIKVAYNTFIGTKIALVNVLMEICDKIPNTNVDAVTNALCLATDRLISKAYLRGGMGDGGGCHPRDNIAMSWISRKLNLSVNFFDHIMTARERQTEYLANIIRSYHAQFPDLPVMICGTAFKPGTNLLIGSPAVLLCNILKENTNEQKAISFKTFDPFVDRLPHTKDWPKEVTLEPHLFFLGCQHPCFSTFAFPPKSIIIDPFRYISPSLNAESKVISIGTGLHA